MSLFTFIVLIWLFNKYVGLMDRNIFFFLNSISLLCFLLSEVEMCI